jgi:hypothetical protein
MHSRCTNAVQTLHISAHIQLFAARHVLKIAEEFFSPKLTPSLPRCVKAGVSFYKKNRESNNKTGGGLRRIL